MGKGRCASAPCIRSSCKSNAFTMLGSSDKEQIVPVSLGRQHATKQAAHRSYAKVFQFLSTVSFVLYWTLWVADITANTPKEHHNVWDVMKNSVGLSIDDSFTSRILSGVSETGQKLKYISKHPINSVTSTDVLFTVISLLTWTFTRDLDVESILENSILAPFVPKHEKHVTFEDNKSLAEVIPEAESEPVLETTTPRKRGRPAKSKAAAAVNEMAGSVRRSTRRSARNADIDSDAESTNADAAYQPSAEIKREVAETEADGVTTGSDLVEAGESTALALFLAFAGGLGQLAAGALGAEVTGPRE
jgi:hypothetical protein